MALGPTGASPLIPVPQGQGGAVAPARLARGLQEAFGFRSGGSSPRTLTPPVRPA